MGININKKALKTLPLDILALVGMRTLILILECLPDKHAKKLSEVYISIIFFLIPKLERTSRINLNMAYPNKTEEEKELIYQKSKKVLAENILGLAHVPRIKSEEIKKKYEMSKGIETLKSLEKSSNGVGVLITSLHFDAFEYLIHIPGILYKPFSMLARGFGLPLVDKWWNSRRQMHGHITFSRKGIYYRTFNYPSGSFRQQRRKNNSCN